MQSEDVLPLINLQHILAKLAKCDDKIGIFNLLNTTLKPLIGFQDSIVLLSNKPRFYETLGSSNYEFETEIWPECSLFTKVNERKYALTTKPYEELEFSFLQESTKVKIDNCLVIYSALKDEPYIILLTNVNTESYEKVVSSECIGILFQQIYLSLIQLATFDRFSQESISLINKFSQLSSLFKELASEWFWCTTSENQFIRVNDAEANESDYERFFIGNSIESLRSENELQLTDKWDSFHQTLANYEDFYEFECELNIKGKYWLCFSGKSQFDEKGSFIGYLGIAKDITQSKEREVALQLQKHKAEEASQTKSKFLTVMSHEIRTPMNAILGMIELLRDTKLTDEQRQWINYANASADILYGLITDVLDFSKIESGTVSIIKKPFNLNLLVDNIVGQFDIIESNHDIVFTVTISEEIPTFVLGDEFRLGQVLFNIIGNAFKYTKAGRITFKVSISEDYLQFEIADSGGGIAKKNLDLIFQPFRQVNDGVNRKNEGVGLGLSISKNLIELMNGSIKVDTQLGLGSTFTVSVPFQAASQDIIALENAPVGHALSVLVAEDNITNQVLIKAFLEKMNHKVTIAEDGQEVIDLIKLKSFDLILMDIMMPRMDGLTAAQIIRDEMHLDVPVYALTANAASDDKAACFKVGMNKVLTKPIRFDTLKASLESLVSVGLNREC